MGKFGYRCSDQGLKTLDDSKLVDYIQELECDNNPDLDAIPTAIGKCKNLETLMANNCSISAIPVELCAASSWEGALATCASGASLRRVRCSSPNW